MNTYFSCLPCFIRQALEAAQLASADERTTEEVLRRSLRRLSDLPFDKTPPHIVKEIHRIVRDLVKLEDPYKELKVRYNKMALDLLPLLREAVSASEDRLQTAARLAVAGNVIDFGHLNSDFDISLNEVIEDSLERPITINRTEDLRLDLERADRILYLTDNAGEIVFDRLLIEEIDRHNERVILGVRGVPIINDATLSDARQAGLSDMVTVMGNGSDAPGTILEECDGPFRKAFEKADLVIAKGQGNYETLSETPGNIYFLLKVKCPSIARDLSCRTGDIVIAKTDHARHANDVPPLAIDDTLSVGLP
ncbi:MAG: DUF89 family protein [Spirochaetes bacterium]|nr:DUF89 family protein [Spirochaetota bacterium]